MDKHKLKDFIDATKEEAGNVVVEEVLPSVVKEAGGFILGECVGILAGEIVGAVLPVANNIRLSYKNSIDFSVSFYNYHEPSIYPCL